MITREGDYAIRVMVYLAGCNNGQHPVSTDLLAKEMEIPYRFLRRIISRMVKAGILKTTRGRGGGVMPARPAAEVTLLDVLNAIDPRSLRMNACVDDHSICFRTTYCTVRKEVMQLQADINQRLQALTFRELAAS